MMSVWVKTGFVCTLFVSLLAFNTHDDYTSGMAYNREWDQGKDWHDPTVWTGNEGKANVRSREDDYSAYGKRRKFNNGVSLGFCDIIRGLKVLR